MSALCADIDDLIPDFIGGMAGIALCKALEDIYRKRTVNAAGKLND